jgi:ABC transport system ATP-binding/permease protein
MDRLVDHLFVFEGDGVIRDYPGNYSQYREAVADRTESPGSLMQAASENRQMEMANGPSQTQKVKRQLSFKEKREFESLEKEIAGLVKEKKEITQKLSSGNTGFEELQSLSLRIGEVTRMLDEKELRWLELSELGS